ncbi:MAG: lysylphosphatidylglycerol synthase transmembrane domain-containing protein [Chitinispirillaceae bacterium]
MSTKKFLISILKWVIIVLPFVWIFTRIELGDLSETISDVAWWTIPVLIFSTLLAMFLQGFRWWVLLRGPLHDLGLGITLRYHYYGIFYSIVLPGSAAQDIVKAALISRKYDYSAVWGATWTFKLLGLLSLVIMSSYGLATIDYSTYSSQHIPTHYVFIFMILLLVLTVLSFSKRFTRPLRRVFSRFIPKRFLSVIENIRQSVYQYKNMPLRLIISFALSFLTQAVLVFNFALVIRGISGEFFLNEVFGFVPIIEILCMIIPLTPNGTGIRESLTAILFRYLGLSAEQLAVFVAVIGLVPVLLKLVGAAPFLIGHKKSDIPDTGQLKEKENEWNEIHHKKDT